MSEDLRNLMSPFRLYDDPTMYQGLPNVKKDSDKVRPTQRPQPSKGKPQKEDVRKDQKKKAPKK
jgi:hypothetical protein